MNYILFIVVAGVAITLWLFFEARREDRQTPLPWELRQKLMQAFEHSSNNRSDLAQSEQAGCFYCLTVGSAKAVGDWADRDQTALCPSCGVDAVLGDSAGYPLTVEFLQQMHDYWFSEEEGT